MVEDIRGWYRIGEDMLSLWAQMVFVFGFLLFLVFLFSMENKFLSVFMFSTMTAEAMQVIHDLRWMLMFVVVLILVDFWFGVNASLKRKEKFRFSRAGRRTCNKFVDYVAYLLLGAIFGIAIFEPLGIATHTTTSAYALGLSCLWELDSIIDHMCELHGVKKRISLKRILIRLITKKDKELYDCITEEVDKCEDGEDCRGLKRIKED